MPLYAVRQDNKKAILGVTFYRAPEGTSFSNLYGVPPSDCMSGKWLNNDERSA
jgi:hypothetical protein